MVQLTPDQSNYLTMSETLQVRTDKTKWYKTRKCGCGDCRFYSLEERGPCPMINEPTAIWLWAYHADMMDCKDYVESPAFAPPTAFNEKTQESREETTETVEEDNNHTPDS